MYFLSTSYTISFTISPFSEKQQAKMKKHEEPTQKKMKELKKNPQRKQVPNHL